MERLRPECTQEICDIRRPGRESGVNKQENDRKKKKSHHPYKGTLYKSRYFILSKIEFQRALVAGESPPFGAHSERILATERRKVGQTEAGRLK